MTRLKEFGVGFEGIAPRRQIACARLAEETGYGSYWGALPAYTGI